MDDLEIRSKPRSLKKTRYVSKRCLPQVGKKNFGTDLKDDKKSFLPQTVYFKRRNKTGESREKLPICWGGYQIYRSKPFKSHSEGTKSLENQEFFKRKFLKELDFDRGTVSGKKEK